MSNITPPSGVYLILDLTVYRMNSRRRSSKSLETIPKVIQPVPIKESSFGSAIKQGFGWGLGNSLAHSLINKITSKPEPISAIKLDSRESDYKQCMLNFDDKEACKYLLKESN